MQDKLSVKEYEAPFQGQGQAGRAWQCAGKDEASLSD